MVPNKLVHSAELPLEHERAYARLFGKLEQVSIQNRSAQVHLSLFHFADLKFLLLFAKISIASIPIDQSSTKLSDSNARRHMLFLLYHHLDNHEETRQHKNVKSHGRGRRSHLRQKVKSPRTIYWNAQFQGLAFVTVSEGGDPLLYFDIIQAQLRAAAFLCFNHPQDYYQMNSFNRTFVCLYVCRITEPRASVER